MRHQFPVSGALFIPDTYRAGLLDIYKPEKIFSMNKPDDNLRLLFVYYDSSATPCWKPSVRSTASTMRMHTKVGSPGAWAKPYVAETISSTWT